MTQAATALITNARDVSTQTLSPHAQRYVRASISPNTERAYRSQVKLWQRWCADYGVIDFPASPHNVANWLAERADAGQAVATIKAGLAGVKFGHDIKNLPFDTQVPEIVKTLAGIQRTTQRIPKQAIPLRASDAIGVVTPAADATLCEIRDAAIVAAGYLFALRRSEIVGLDYARHRAGDGVLSLTAATLDIELLHSKTNAGVSERVTVPKDGNGLAVAAIERWVTAAGITEGSPLFRRIFKGGRKVGGRLSSGTVGRIIKRVAGGEFSGHSLRVGLVVSAAEAGADLRSIASVTRHKSLEMPRRYSERADQLRTSPFKRDGVGLG